MKSVLRLMFAILVLAALALLLPFSPLYLPDVLTSGPQYEGKSARRWTRVLNESEAKDRKAAAFALGSIGKDAGESVPELARILTDDPDRECRAEAALALTKMAPASKEAVPALMKALTDSEPLVRLNAALALSKLDADARPAVPELITAMQSPENTTNAGAFHVTIQEMAALALARATAGTADAVPLLTAALEGAKTGDARISYLRALAYVGPEARTAAPQIRAAKKAGSKAVKEEADIALQKIGLPIEE